jgi:hypothetical protein
MFLAWPIRPFQNISTPFTNGKIKHRKEIPSVQSDYTCTGMVGEGDLVRKEDSTLICPAEL